MILIVDDEPDIRDSLQEFFEDEGYEVTNFCIETVSWF